MEKLFSYDLAIRLTATQVLADAEQTLVYWALYHLWANKNRAFSDKVIL